MMSVFRGVRPIGAIRSRTREAAFWRTQGLIVLVTAFHVLLEATPFAPGTAQHLAASLQHVSVSLYIIPVAYAGLAYALEGGILTALFCASFAAINIPLFHRANFEWLAELSLILIVIVIGVAVSIPVEQERRSRRRAEAANRRLAMLNEVAQASLRPGGVMEMADSALARLVDVLEARGACLGLWHRADANAVVLTSHAADPETADHLKRRVRAWAEGPALPPPAEGGSLATVLDAGDLHGVLWILVGEDRQSVSRSRDLLAAVGNQLTVAVENVLLHEQERELLESYTRHVTRAHEEERKHLARDLHDGAVQDLTVVSRQLDAAAESTSPAIGERLVAMREEIQSTVGELRRLARDLRPTLLDDLGLMPAVEWLVTDLGERLGIDARLDAGPSRRLDPEIEGTLFRVVQEALRNVERHSGASRVELSMSFDPGAVAVRIQDDGRGFVVPGSLTSVVSSGRLGLMGIHERIQLIGGTVSIESRPGAGTRLSVTIPTIPQDEPSGSRPSADVIPRPSAPADSPETQPVRALTGPPPATADDLG